LRQRGTPVFIAPEVPVTGSPAGYNHGDAHVHCPSQWAGIVRFSLAWTQLYTEGTIQAVCPSNPAIQAMVIPTLLGSFIDSFRVCAGTWIIRLPPDGRSLTEGDDSSNRLKPRQNYHVNLQITQLY